MTTSSSNETANSYQGVIDAFNAVREAQNEYKKAYPPNFQGIITAILDLRKWGQAPSLDDPPGWMPIADDEGNIIGGSYLPTPENGRLWFDSRQGRMFVWSDDGWYQTNGADGIATLSETAPTMEVPGTFWYNSVADILYIYDGSGWEVVGGASGVTTTSTLPLPTAERNLVPTSTTYLSDAHSTTLSQSNLNEWMIRSLIAIDAGIDAVETVTMDVASSAPSNPADGDLWFDHSGPELKVWYNGSWYGTGQPLTSDAAFTNLQSTVTTNKTTDDARYATTDTRISALENAPTRSLSISIDQNADSITFNDSQGANSSVEFDGANGITIDPSGGSITIDAGNLKTTLEAAIASSSSATEVSALQTLTTAMQNNITALQASNFLTQTDLTPLTTQVNALPTTADVALKASLSNPAFLTDVSIGGNKVTNLAAPTAGSDAARKTDVDDLKTYADNTFVTQSNHSFNNLTIQRSDLSEPAIDLSTASTDGISAFKFKTYGGTGYTTFGNTVNENEYAWEFSGDEQFGWIGSSGKVAGIDKDEVVVKSLSIGDFVRSSTSSEQVLNRINVKDKLAAHDTSLATHTTQIAALMAGDYNTDFGIYYSDSAPSGTIENGALWFDSHNIRLNVRHSGAWIHPDRVEDTTLKTAIRNAVNTSTDYATLKTNLLSALS